MKDSLVITTKLTRMIALLLIFGTCAISLTVANRDLTGTLVMVIALFYFLYILNRRLISKVTADRENVTFEYLENKKKSLTLPYKDLLFKKGKIKSMLGESYVIEIYRTGSGERLFGISKKMFRKKADYNAFLEYFGIETD